MSITLTNDEETVAIDVDQDSTQDATGPEITTDTTDPGDAEGSRDGNVPLPAKSDQSQLQTEKTKSSRRKSEPKNATPLECQMIEVALGQIYDEHIVAEKVRKDVGIAFQELPVNKIPKSGLSVLAEHFPLRVVKKDDAYYCVGGIRFFRLLKNHLRAETRLHVVLQQGNTDSDLENQILFDLFVMPLLSGLNAKDRRNLGILWESDRGMKLIQKAFGCDSKQLAAILGCDPRTLKPSKVARSRIPKEGEGKVATPST